jgi:deferrochelatase/peroxidase EfeB
VCFQRDPTRQFLPIQRRLSERDRLAEYIEATGGGLFAIPPGARQVKDYVGSSLFGV